MLFSLLAQLAAFAQNDTLVQLPAVEVSAASLRKEQPGSFDEHWPEGSLLPQNGQSVASFLQNQTGIYVKSYGGGSLATVSIRGASASQTAVLWNGFQVQSPMLGQLDWSLLPVHFSDEISLQHGGNSAVWGSGAIGGAVLMENKPDFDTKLQVKIGSGAGSFGSWNGQAAAKFSTQNLASSTRIFYQKAKNDFTYQTAPSQLEKRQTNADMWQKGLLQELYFRPAGNVLLGWQTWLQNSYREIPPTTTQTRSVAKQADEALRTALNFRWNGGQNILQGRSAFFCEAIHYQDVQIKLDAPSHFWTSTTELEWQRFFSKKWMLQLAGNQTFTKAFIKNYTDSKSKRSQTAAFGSLRFVNGRTSAQLDGRQELVDGKLVPFTPSLGLEQQVLNWLKIGGKIGRNYRLPTLNDLHWQPGGNPDLLAESGWSSELNADFSFKKNLTALRFTAAVFNRNIKNWILWHPKPGQPLWSASNIAEVWSRGLENRIHLVWSRSKWGFNLNGGYDIIRSTNQKAIELPKIGAGQQLIYVPEHQGFASLKIQFNTIGLGYRHQFTGAVLTDLGSLSSFQTGSFELDFEQEIWQLPARIFFQIDNCWDADYRVVERRPIPGRAYQIGLSLSFTKN